MNPPSDAEWLAAYAASPRGCRCLRDPDVDALNHHHDDLMPNGLYHILTLDLPRARSVVAEVQSINLHVCCGMKHQKFDLFAPAWVINVLPHARGASADRMIRIIRYIESNPVLAQLVESGSDDAFRRLIESIL